MARQIHPFPPLYDKDSRVLILGSFPSVKTREVAYYYGHPQNRFWKVIAGAFGCEAPKTNEEKRHLILSNHLAIWDVIAECDITASSDSSIKNVKPNDIGEILRNSRIEKIFINGKTAEKYYLKYIRPSVGLEAVCLPSTSPANATWRLDRLIEAWSVIAQV